MNTNNGTIIDPEAFNDLLEDEKKDYVIVENRDMTKKQQREQKVSLHDHRSKLGKQLTQARQQKRFNRAR
jgi:hypothetical protein